MGKNDNLTEKKISSTAVPSVSDEKNPSQKRAETPRRGGPMGAAVTPVEKAKDFKGTLKRLLGYMKPYRWRFAAVVFLAVLSTVFSIIGPKILGMATTSLAEGVKTGSFDMNYVGKILLFLLGLYVISALCSFIMQYMMSSVSQMIVYGMRREIKDKLDRLPLKYYDGRTHGEIMSRVTNDMDTIAQTLQQSMTQLITSVVMLVGILVMMLSISGTMTLIAIVALPFCGLVTFGVAKKAQGFFIANQRHLGDLSGHVEEMYAGHKIIKAFGREDDSIEKMHKINDDLYEVGWKAQFISGAIMPLINLINNLGYVLVCIVGGVFVARGAVPIGDIQAFIQYMRQFTQPIQQTANIANIIQSTIAGAERVFEILDEKEAVPDVENPISLNKEDVHGEVIFDNISFRYSPEKPLIDNMNIYVKPSQTIAIVGPTGAGKTTLVNLLMRFYELDDGEIRIDGKDISKMKRNDLRGLFGMVLQDTWLFKGTIRDNIKYSCEDATDEQILAAAKAARADHFIRTMPHGYDTELNEEASNISQGQRQLLTIARAMLADPPILILDEATSSVDTRTETLIQDAMNKMMKGRTNFVIAHRLSTIRNADLILVVRDGSIVEKGTHEELMNMKGFYSELYNSQFNEGEEEIL